jgi:hypothetical protein
MIVGVQLYLTVPDFPFRVLTMEAVAILSMLSATIIGLSKHWIVLSCDLADIVGLGLAKSIKKFIIITVCTE